MAAWRHALAAGSIVVLVSAAAAARPTAGGPGRNRAGGGKPELVEPWGDSGGGVLRSGWGESRSPADSSVPAGLFVRAMTSLPGHYQDDHEALEAHLREEHAIFAASETPDDSSSSGGGGGGGGGRRRAHLCCTDYRDGPALKSALEAAAGDKRFVRTALNSNSLGGYCAVAHVSSAAAAEAAAETVRCSPVTHASKEPLSLLAPSTATESSSSHGGGGGSGRTPLFGLKLGPGVQEGDSRGLVVTMSPGSLPMDDVAEEVVPTGNTRGGSGGGEGGAGRMRRNLSSRQQSSSLAPLERTWRDFWGGARGSDGARALEEAVPWTSSPGGGGGGGGARRRSLLAGDGTGDALEPSSGVRVSRAREFHGGKAAGYGAALAHLGEKMVKRDEEEEEEGGVGETLAGVCGLGNNLEFVHGGNDLLYLRGIRHPEHDEETSAACFIALVGFLSAQPEVMHIHPEPRAEANNKVLTAYIEGGEPTETPMRVAGLTGAGQVIGVTDTGLDDNSCFFRDEDGSVPRTTMEAADFYPDQRKVIQYVVFADDTDTDGHGTHVAGIAAGKVYDDWEADWAGDVSKEVCNDAGLIMSCFGDCVAGTIGGSCHWNPELSCPLSDCDVDVSCDDYTEYDFPCFEDPVDELPEASGVASDAQLAFFDIGTEDGGLIIPDDIGDMWDAQYAAGARVISNSWSLVTMTEPTARDVQLDEWVHDHPDTLVVFGAGNNGFEDHGFNPGSVQSPATGKTAMTVGASNSGPGRAYAYYDDATSNFDGVLWPSDEEMFQVSPFSARGPVGRFTAKPDVVAPGLMVHSAKASLSDSDEETCALDSLGGTSMSAPAVAGAAALVRQFFEQGFLASYLGGAGLCGGTDENEEVAAAAGGVYAEAGLCEAFAPSGYLVKAVLVNSAMWLGDMQMVSYENKTQCMSVLDFAQGFGAVQLAASVPTEGAPLGAFYHEHELASDELYYYLIYVSDASKNVSVTVAWFDPPSPVSSYNLLHDLDMFVMSVDARRYYRSNHHDTIATMCGADESCAEKYEFTYENGLADYMNPVERVTVPSSDLEEGYHVVGVRARTLTESDVQAYGLAAAGGGLVLHGMSKNWTDLVLETDSTHGTGVGTEEPDPDREGNGPTPAPSVLVAEGSADGGGGVTPTGDSVINAPTSAPVETATGSTSGSGTSMAGDEDGFSG
ncbi:unnamed protein product, partial [Ectocarpus sp. 8 AP-2014]